MTMQFRLGKRVFRVATWVFRRVRFRTRPNRYCRLGSTSPSHSYNHNPMTKLLTWGTKLKRGAQSLCKKSGSALVWERASAVPKGHLAVYVAEDNGECRRVLVPVIYFNHPLFSGLLREAEKEFGFEHPGGITIPCRLTEFERVKNPDSVRVGFTWENPEVGVAATFFLTVETTGFW